MSLKYWDSALFSELFYSFFIPSQWFWVCLLNRLCIWFPWVIVPSSALPGQMNLNLWLLDLSNNSLKVLNLFEVCLTTSALYDKNLANCAPWMSQWLLYIRWILALLLFYCCRGVSRYSKGNFLCDTCVLVDLWPWWSGQCLGSNGRQSLLSSQTQGWFCACAQPMRDDVTM